MSQDYAAEHANRKPKLRCRIFGHDWEPLWPPESKLGQRCLRCARIDWWKDPHWALVYTTPPPPEALEGKP